MSNNRPDVTDEEIGMRTFHLRKSRAVERAMERLREGMGAEYASFTSDELDTVAWALGELWAYVARNDWDDLHFGNLDVTDVRRILGFAREIHKHTRNSVDVLNDLYDLIRSKG